MSDTKFYEPGLVVSASCHRGFHENCILHFCTCACHLPSAADAVAADERIREARQDAGFEEWFTYFYADWIPSKGMELLRIRNVARAAWIARGERKL